MPPKKAPAASKKTETKKKDKIIEDKTFGLKNKKGAKNQKFIAQIEKQVKSGGQHPLGQPGAKKIEKEAKLKEQKELALLFKPVQTQKLDKGTDPKSVVCAFFKQGQCGKGDKCKFSHDLTLERKDTKRSMYVDMRDDEEETMENWNEEKLKEVVDKKLAVEKRTMPTTDIICKFFLDAVEKSKYGWFWECPNGERCIYRHALPVGFILKKDKKKLEDLSKRSDLSLVDLIETERAALGPNQTKITLDTFLAWKKRKVSDKIEKMTKDDEKKRTDFKAGRQFGLSGREMFSFNPELANDGDGMDDGEVAFDSYMREDDDEGVTVEYKELDLEKLTSGAQEVDGSGTIAMNDRLKQIQEESATAAASNGAGGDDGDTNSEEIADAAPINENLFLDEDLEGLDDELNELDLEQGD